MSDVVIYSVGLCYASACALAELSGEEVAHAVNLQHPSGVKRWRVSEDQTFADGLSPNPAPCEITPGRKHWLLEC
jgi:hypothetical protein